MIIALPISLGVIIFLQLPSGKKQQATIIAKSAEGEAYSPIIRRNFFCPARRLISMELAQNKCTTYRAGSPPLTRKETMELLAQVPGWSLDNGHLTRTFERESASACITFFSDVMDLATQEGHFPDISLKESRYFEVQFYTYPAGGLTLNDFIMAAKLNEKGKAQ